MTDLVPAPTSAWTVYCDGSSWPNPGRMGLGAVMIDPHGQRHTLSQATHATGCNNEAELRALMAALQTLQSHGAEKLCVYSDNSILVAQLKDDQAPPIARLANLFEDARRLLASFESARLQWIPRHRNGEADALARAALGLPDKATFKPSSRRRR